MSPEDHRAATRPDPEMNLIQELHPYVAATWREIFEMVDEAGEEGRRELTEALQVHLGRPDLEEAQLVEVIWLTVGARRAPLYRYDPPAGGI